MYPGPCGHARTHGVAAKREAVLRVHGTRRTAQQSTCYPLAVASLASLLFSWHAVSAFQSSLVTPKTSPKVAEWLLDPSVKGSRILHESPELAPLGASSQVLVSRNGQCEAKSNSRAAEMPCVLPINVNMSLAKRGAGERTAVDVSMDVYPGPKCKFEEPKVGQGSYAHQYKCEKTQHRDDDEFFWYHSPLRAAIFHNEDSEDSEENIATVIRFIFPSGFDASELEVDNNTLVLWNGTWTEARTEGNTTSFVERIGPVPIEVRRLRYETAPQPIQFGYREPQASSRPFQAFGEVTSFRTGTMWGLRDPKEPDGSFDPRRIVDVVTTKQASSQSAYNLFAQVDEALYAQRLKMRLEGLVTRRTTGHLGSASVEDAHVFAVQIYQTTVADLRKAESGETSEIPADKFLMRYYNNHIKDPCLVGRQPVSGKACPVTALTGLNYSISEWFRDTQADEEALLCPPGTFRVDDAGLDCKACPDGYVSLVWLSVNCSACPRGTFADLSTAFMLNGGASECRLCAAGTYSGDSPTPTCTACPPGSYSVVGADACLKCAKGFSSPSGASACEHCPPNTSTSAAGMSLCRPICPAGAAGVGGIEPCESCALGTAAPAQETSQCASCAPGTATSGSLTRPALIGPGGGAVECVACAAGAFAELTGSLACVECPAQSYQGAEGATTCFACPVDSQAEAAGHRLPEAESKLSAEYRESVYSPLAAASVANRPRLTTRTLSTGAKSANECLPNCLPGEASRSAGLDAPGQPCVPCATGTANDLVGSTVCAQCDLGYHTPAPGHVVCLPCDGGSYSDIRGSRVCDRCTPGFFSPIAATGCTPCSNGSFSPVPGTSALNGCLECPEGSYAEASATGCTACPAGMTTLLPAPSTAADCVPYSDDDVVAHWEMRSEGVVAGSRYSRSARAEVGGAEGGRGFACVEGQGLVVEPAAFKELVGSGMGDAYLRGPPCTMGTEWDVAAAAAATIPNTTHGGNSSINAKTMIVSDGRWEAMQMDGGGVNTGLYANEVDALVSAGLLPTSAITVETWITIETDAAAGRTSGADRGMRGIVGALQKGPNYEKGWGLSHWLDRNRKDVWYVGFELAVEANNNVFHDFNDVVHPGLRSDHGGMFLVVGRVKPAPSAGQWLHVVASYDPLESTVSLFVNGILVTQKRPCRTQAEVEEGTGGAFGVGCGSILYPSTLDYWSSKLHPSHLTLGGIENVAGTARGGSSAGYDHGEFYRHHGLVGMVKIFRRKVSAEEVSQRFSRRREMYASSSSADSAHNSALLAAPWYWVATVIQPDSSVAKLGLQVASHDFGVVLSPDVTGALVDWNRPSFVTQRGGTKASVVVRGRFDASLDPSDPEHGWYRCVWRWASVEQSSVPGEVLDNDGHIVTGLAQSGDMLRCEFPDYKFGATNQAILTVAHRARGQLPEHRTAQPLMQPLLQRVCLDRGCGYSAPAVRAARNLESWWENEGVGALHGAKVDFSFEAVLCGPGEISEYAGASPWCQKCPSGKYSDTRGSFACHLCPRGTWAAEGATSCTLCPVGTSSKLMGATSVDVCQPACGPGTFSEDGGLAPCKPCARGTFASAVGMSACKDCAVGYTTPAPSADEGAHECIEACEPGHVGPNGTSPCTACLPGTFAAKAGLGSCTPCVYGRFSTAGQAACQECPGACQLALLTSADPLVVAVRTQCCQA
jgi:hypothetical protein